MISDHKPIIPKWVQTIGVVSMLAVIFLSAVATFAFVLLTHRIADTSNRACRDVNDVRMAVTEMVDDSVLRSVRASNATIASPNSTQEQKAVAAANLKQLRALSSQVNARFKTHEC